MLLKAILIQGRLLLKGPPVHSIQSAFWNREDERLRALWRILAHLLLFVLLAVAAQALLGPLLSSPVFQGMYQLAVFGGSAILAARWFDRRPIADLGLRFDREWFVDLGFGLGLGMVLMGSIFGLQYGLGWITLSATFTSNGTAGFILPFLGAVGLYLCVGVSEEIWTRGYLLTNLAEGMKMGHITARSSSVAALVITSAVFGMLHGNNPNATSTSTLNIMAAGLMLGTPFILTGQLAMPIGLHFSWNFFQGAVFGFPVSGYAGKTAQIVSIEQGGPPWWTGGSFGPEAGGVGLIAIVAGTAATIAWIAWRKGGVRLERSIALPPAVTERYG